ncbi:DUF998 domain-containing protein [Nocardia sp. NPDC020380]|uniref:DUF998 domain-containing protein n=1 Tax=Nocardia sp. NPDC020380 TaxID=3364309 RepID=UPI0037B445F7
MNSAVPDSHHDRIAKADSTIAAALATERTRALAAGGLVGPALFASTALAAGLIRSGYSPVRQAISDLGVGPHDWMLDGSLILLAPLLAGCCVALRRAIGRQAVGWLPLALILLPGFGFAWAGLFTEAPSTVALHWVVGMPLIAVGAILGFLLIGLRLRRIPGWRAFGTYSIATAATALAIMLVMFGTWTMHIGGFTERLFFTVILAWYVAAAVKIIRLTRRTNRG